MNETAGRRGRIAKPLGWTVVVLTVLGIGLCFNTDVRKRLVYRGYDFRTVWEASRQVPPRTRYVPYSGNARNSAAEFEAGPEETYLVKRFAWLPGEIAMLRYRDGNEVPFSPTFFELPDDLAELHRTLRKFEAEAAAR